MASQGDHVDSARILLYHKAPVDDITVDYLTALHVAAHCGHVKVAKLLLDRKADPNARALNGFTPLHIACKKNRIKIVELLLKHGASIEATTESGLSPLHVASFMGCMNIVIYLIQSGANPDVPTVRGETPLHLAVRANQIDIIRILLRNGASVDARAREEQTPLHIASRLGNVDIVSLLLQHGAAVDATTKDMYTALHIASKEGQEEVVAVLLDHEASLVSTTKRGFTPLHLAAKYGNIMVARLLLQKNVAVDAQGKNGLTPLHMAAHYNHINEALLLLEKGASPHAAAKNGYTPLHIAAKKNQMEIATSLFEYGAKCNAVSKAGYTPLHLSSQEGHTDMTTFLIEHQADVNRKANNGLTPLHLCAQEDWVNVASVLVKNKADIGPQTNAGYTPLHVASHFGQINMVRFLLQNNADIRMTTEQGYTALHQAAQQGHTPVVNLLLENKASPDVITAQGQTALSIAQRLGYISVVETLKVVTETTVITTTTTVTEEKYKVVSPEMMQETFMTDSEDEGGEDTMLGDQSYRYLTADEMKSLGDDSLPIDVTKDEKQHDSIHMIKDSTAPMVEEDKLSPQHASPVEAGFIDKFSPDNIDISRAPVHAGFLVSFMVDARGGAMRGCRHSGVRVIIPPRKASMPMRITCRYLRKEKLIHPPPLMEGEACASRILEVGPVGARFLGPVIIEVPHFASLRGREREVAILRSDTGETWREHALEASEEAVQDVLNESFEGDELSALEDLNTNRITRILTTDFPQYFAIITRIRQEVHCVGPEGGMVSSTVVPQVQAIFPEGALQKKIRVGLQAQPISPDLVAKLLGNRVAVSPIVNVEPRRRKFHKPITLTIPVPQAATKGMINQYSGDAPTLRLLCSITGSTKSGGSSKAQWEDVTGSTPLTFVNDCVSFTTTVSARFWLMDCRQVKEVSRFAMELYQEAVHVPFMAKFVIFAKRHDPNEAQLRVFCMTDDKEDKTLETQEHFTEIAKSRDIEVLENKLQFFEFAGNLVPVTNSGEQLKFAFHAFHENRLPFRIRVKDPHVDPIGRIVFMREPKVGRGEPPQTPICNLNIAMPDVVLTESIPAALELVTLEKKYDFMQESGLSKPESIHRANLRLSDIARELDKDWVVLAHEFRVPESDIEVAKSEYPEDAGDQALVMLRLWLQKTGSRATGNELEKGLRKINRSDIIKKCMFNVELVTDDVEKAVAKVHLDQSGFDVFKEELGSSREASMRRGASIDTSYDEQDLMKEAESAAETSSETGSLFERDQASVGVSEEKENLHPAQDVLLENAVPMNDLEPPKNFSTLEENLINQVTNTSDTEMEGNVDQSKCSAEPHIKSETSASNVLAADWPSIIASENITDGTDLYFGLNQAPISMTHEKKKVNDDDSDKKFNSNLKVELSISSKSSSISQHVGNSATKELETSDMVMPNIQYLTNGAMGNVDNVDVSRKSHSKGDTAKFENIEAEQMEVGSVSMPSLQDNEYIETINLTNTPEHDFLFEQEVEARLRRVSKTPPPSPAEVANTNFVPELKEHIEMFEEKNILKEKLIKCPDVTDIPAEGHNMGLKLTTESETWPSAELDTSQVSISSLPDDEKSELTTATGSSNMDADKIQENKEWSELDECGQMKHVVQRTTHMTLTMEEKLHEQSSDQEGIEFQTGVATLPPSLERDSEDNEKQEFQCLELPQECLEITEHVLSSQSPLLETFRTVESHMEIMHQNDVQYVREINEECLEVSEPLHEHCIKPKEIQLLDKNTCVICEKIEPNGSASSQNVDKPISTMELDSECITSKNKSGNSLQELHTITAKSDELAAEKKGIVTSMALLPDRSFTDAFEDIAEHAEESGGVENIEISHQPEDFAKSDKISSDNYLPLAFDNTAFVGADLIDACEHPMQFRSRSPYEVVRDDFEFNSDRSISEDIVSKSDKFEVSIHDRHLTDGKMQIQQFASFEAVRAQALRRKPILQHIPSEISEEDLVETELSSPSEHEFVLPELLERGAEVFSKTEVRTHIDFPELPSDNLKDLVKTDKSSNQLELVIEPKIEHLEHDTKESSIISELYEKSLSQKSKGKEGETFIQDDELLPDKKEELHQKLEGFEMDNHDNIEYQTESGVFSRMSTRPKTSKTRTAIPPKTFQGSINCDDLGAVGGRGIDEEIHIDEFSPEKQHYSSISDDTVDAEIGEILSFDQVDDDIIDRPQTPEPPLDENINGPKRNFKISSDGHIQCKEMYIQKFQRTDISKTLPTLSETANNLETQFNLDISEQEVRESFSESESTGLRKMGSFNDITTVHITHPCDSSLIASIDAAIVSPGLDNSEISEECPDFTMHFEREMEDHSEEAMDLDSDQFSEDKDAVYSYGMRFEREHDLEEEEIPCYGDLYTHHEVDEEGIEEIEKTKISITSKTGFDILAGRKFFTKSAETDDMSMSSLQEFERLEEEIRSGRRSSIGSIDSINGKHYHSKSGEHDDLSMNSLTEFEKLERECSESEKLENGAMDPCNRLAEIEEGHESQMSEASQETLSDNGRDDESENYDWKLHKLGKMMETAENRVGNGEIQIKYPELTQDSCTIDDKTDPLITTVINKAKTNFDHKNEFDNINLKSDVNYIEKLSLNKHTDDTPIASAYVLQYEHSMDPDILQSKGIETDILANISSMKDEDIDQDSLHEERSKLESLSGDDKCEYHDSLRDDKSCDLDSLHDIQDVMRDSLHEEKAIEEDSLHEMDILPDESSLSLESSLAAVIDVSHDSLSEKVDICQLASEQDFDNDSLKELNLESVIESVFGVQDCEVTVVKTGHCQDSMISSADSLEPTSSTATHAPHQLENECLMSSSLNSVQTSEDYTMISSVDVSESTTGIYDTSFNQEIMTMKEEKKVFIDFEGNIQSQEPESHLGVVDVRVGTTSVRYNGERTQESSVSSEFQQRDNSESHNTEDGHSEHFEPDIEVEEIDTVDEKGNLKRIRRIKRVMHTTSDYRSTSTPTSVEEKFKEYLRHHGTLEETGKSVEEIKEERSLDSKGNVVIVRTVEQHVTSDPVVHCQTFTGNNAHQASEDFVNQFRMETISKEEEYEDVDQDGNIVRVVKHVKMEPTVRTVTFSGPNTQKQMDEFMKQFQGQSDPAAGIHVSSTSSVTFHQPTQEKKKLKTSETVQEEEAVLEPDCTKVLQDTGRNSNNTSEITSVSKVQELSTEQTVVYSEMESSDVIDVSQSAHHIDPHDTLAELKDSGTH